MQTPGGESLRARVLEAILSQDEILRDQDRFEALAAEVFAYQFEANPIYRAYCVSREVEPTTVAVWTDIPAVPTDAFKAAALVCGDPDSARAVFRTSGTSLGSADRGAHYLIDTDVYSAALLASFRRHVLPDLDRIRILSLVPTSANAPDSSLSFMVSTLVHELGHEDSVTFGPSQITAAREVVSECRKSIDKGDPVLLIGTSFSFVHLLDSLRDSGEAVALPGGSRIVDTGGFKGKSREIPRADLYRMMTQGFGVPGPWILNEYGMTEMSSQFYDGSAGSALPLADRWHAGPHWVRSVAVDPETLRPLPPGRRGVLRHMDLANVDSVAALQTADVGQVTTEGIRLEGRARGAEARGCSIAMDELLNAVENVKRPESAAIPTGRGVGWRAEGGGF